MHGEEGMASGFEQVFSIMRIRLPSSPSGVTPKDVGILERWLGGVKGQEKRALTWE